MYVLNNINSEFEGSQVTHFFKLTQIIFHSVH